ncbi:PIN domain-containing protein [Chakrabartyella piscis]|uniref:PIN domain-containing protein n=1 Tax=Chakrabartyella piscis TaxID=2918914 RepID=UPI0029588E5E|nr:PIN domain-containing protein [Chakrabartyella piscis]
MRKAINEYIELSVDEKENLWSNAVFVFDTNVFLNLYRYSQSTRKQLFAALNQLKERIWMPYQVAVELMKNRYEVIWETKNSYAKLNQDAQAFVEKCRQTLRIEKNETDLLELNNYIEKWIERIQAQNLLVNSYSNDEILNEILELFDGKVGSPYEEDTLSKIENDGKIRYSKQIPPGYKDTKKTNEHDSYGDLFVWKDILQYATENKSDIIFVTHDQKEDWWNIIHGQTIGPRIELRNEFFRETGQNFHMYNMISFLSNFNSDTDITVNKEAIDEVGLFSSVLRRSIPRAELKNYYQTLDDSNRTAAKIRFEIMRLENKNRKRADSIRSIESNYTYIPRPLNIQEQLDNSRSNMKKDILRIELLNQRLLRMM